MKCCCFPSPNQEVPGKERNTGSVYLAKFQAVILTLDIRKCLHLHILQTLGPLPMSCPFMVKNSETLVSQVPKIKNKVTCISTYNKVIMKSLTRIPFGVSYISDSDPGTHFTSKNAEQALKKALQWNFYHPDRGPRRLD